MTLLFLFLSFFFGISMLLLLKRRNKLNLPPSPPKLPIIGNFHQLGTLPHRTLRSLSQKYGPLMMLHLGQLPLLVVSSADMAREVMQTHDLVFASRPHLTVPKALVYDCNDISFAAYGETWRQKKKLCVIELLSHRRVQLLKIIREEEAEVLFEKIRKEVKDDGCTVNLSEMLIRTADNIICRCLFGKKYDAEGLKFGELGRKMMNQIMDFTLGDLFPSLGWVDVLSGRIEKYKATFAEIDTFFEDEIAAHRRKGRVDPNKKDFLDSMLELQDGGNADFELTQTDLKAILLDMLIGASDSTSTTLEWAMAELMKHPSLMKKAQEEVRRVVGKKTKIEVSDVNQMEYMKCIIKETFRLHPPAPLLVPRETTSRVKVGGYDIPNKTMVFVNAWGIQRDPKSWEMPEEFIPERFENNDIDFINGQDFHYTPFGSGRRKCPGIAFGLASVEYFLSNLLYWFDWELPTDGPSVQDLDMTEKFGLTASKTVPLYLQAIPYNNF